LLQRPLERRLRAKAVAALSHAGEARRAHRTTLWERARPRLFGLTHFAISTIRANRVFSFSANRVSADRIFAALEKQGLASLSLGETLNNSPPGRMLARTPYASITV